jgi:hypothetical protein
MTNTNNHGGPRPKTRPDDLRGGVRPGAGKPALSSTEPTVRKTITLPVSLVRRLEEIGGGNVSLAVRRLLAREEESNAPTQR